MRNLRLSPIGSRSLFPRVKLPSAPPRANEPHESRWSSCGAPPAAVNKRSTAELTFVTLSGSAPRTTLRAWNQRRVSSWGRRFSPALHLPACAGASVAGFAPER